MNGYKITINFAALHQLNVTLQILDTQLTVSCGTFCHKRELMVHLHKESKQDYCLVVARTPNCQNLLSLNHP